MDNNSENVAATFASSSFSFGSAIDKTFEIPSR